MSIKSKFITILVAFAYTIVFFIQTGCQANAISKDEIAITTSSKDARKAFLDARQKFEDIRFDEAREGFSQAIKLDNDFALAHLYRAFTATDALDFQTHLQKAHDLKSHVSEGEQLRIDATFANVNNNPVRALKLSIQLVNKFPKSKRAFQNLGNVYRAQNEEDKAITAYETAIELDKDYAPAYNLLGYAYREKGDFNKAEEAFKNYIKLLPLQANPYDSIADLYSKMGRYQDAIENYKKAVEINPNFAFSQRKVGTNLIFMGDYDAGRKAYQKAMAMEPTIAGKITDMLLISQSYLYEGNYDKALSESDNALQKAAGLNFPGIEADIHARRCSIFLEKGDLKNAEQSVATCRKVVTESDLMSAFKDNFAKSVLFDEALIAAKNKDFKTAMSKAEILKTKIDTEKDPLELKNYYQLLGHINFQKGDYQAAIENYKMGDQKNPYTLYHLALAEEKAGNSVNANELFKKVANWNESSLNYAMVRTNAVKQVQSISKK